MDVYFAFLIVKLCWAIYVSDHVELTWYNPENICERRFRIRGT